MSKRDYYDVLGIAKGSSPDEIKKAYRKRARETHPDVNKAADAEAKFKEVQEAYDVLSDSQKRSTYDRFGHEAANQGGFGGSGGFEGFDFGDIFSSFFGGGSQGNASARANAPRKGQDIHKRMRVNFAEAVTGGEKKIKTQVYEECQVCHGSGAHSKNDIETCSTCRGSGSVIQEQQTIFGRTRTQATCPKCQGRGKTIKKRCGSCSGDGVVSSEKVVSVKIPAGIDTNQQLRMQGFGHKGVNGGPSGDLYIVFEVEIDDRFERSGDDLIMEMPLTVTQATLGADIEIPTPYGAVSLKIPAGTQADKTFRLKGKGMPNVRGKTTGDLHVISKIVIPTKLSKEQEKLFEKLADTNLENNDSSRWDRFKSVFK
jgi:molecular chaperone DnaJ